MGAGFGLKTVDVFLHPLGYLQVVADGRFHCFAVWIGFGKDSVLDRYRGYWVAADVGIAVVTGVIVTALQQEGIGEMIAQLQVYTHRGERIGKDAFRKSF